MRAAKGCQKGKEGEEVGKRVKERAGVREREGRGEGGRGRDREREDERERERGNAVKRAADVSEPREALCDD